MTENVGRRRRLRVGSWPGPNFSYNAFVHSFCDGLIECGIEIVDVQDPRTLTPTEIDILHIHWPEQTFWAEGRLLPLMRRIAGTIQSLQRLRAAGVRIVWMVHDLRPHDLPFKHRLLWKRYERQLCEAVDGFVTLSPDTVPVVRREIAGLRDKPSVSAWHPPYELRQPTVPRAKMREELGVPQDAYLFAFLGMVRPYKGVEELIRAFGNLPGGGHALVIAGEALSWSYEKKVRRAAKNNGQIYLLLRRLTDEEFINIGAAADMLVLPFLRYLHSGSLIHALSQHRAAITPHTPFADGLAGIVGTDWVQRYTPPLTGEILANAHEVSGQPHLEPLSREMSSQRLKDFYQSLMSKEE